MRERERESSVANLWMSHMCLLEPQSLGRHKGSITNRVETALCLSLASSLTHHRANESLIFGRLSGEAFSNKTHFGNHAFPCLACREVRRGRLESWLRYCKIKTLTSSLSGFQNFKDFVLPNCTHLRQRNCPFALYRTRKYETPFQSIME